MTVCTDPAIELQRNFRQNVTVQFDGSRISSDGGALLLRDLDQKLSIIDQAATCFTDFRDQRYVEHDLDVLLRQRIFGLALGYEDISDHDALRDDGLLALACGRSDFLGQQRRQAADKGKGLAAHATLHRLELAQPVGDDAVCSQPQGPNKITCSLKECQNFFIDVYARLFGSAIPKQVILDLDATDSTIHGDQEGKYFRLFTRICGSISLKPHQQEGASFPPEPVIGPVTASTNDWLRREGGQQEKGVSMAFSSNTLLWDTNSHGYKNDIESPV